jgi:hypothetical protein
MSGYRSEILDSTKKTEIKNGTSTDYYEVTVSFPAPTKLWLSICTPDVKNQNNNTQIQVLVKDNKSNKILTFIGQATIMSGSVLPIFGGALIDNKTLVIRAADPISVWFESKLDT